MPNEYLLESNARRRERLYRWLRWFARERFYDWDVKRYGYISAIRIPFFGCVAFRRDDGSLQFKW